MKRAFGPVEQMLALAWIGLVTWGIGATLLQRAAPPPWLQPAGSAWV